MVFHCNLLSVDRGYTFCVNVDRNDEKTAADYKVTGGSVLHLVLALRGGH